MLIGAAIYWGFVQKQYKWTPIEGRIVESKVRGGGPSFRPYVAYVYEFRGRSYRGDHLISGQIYSNWPGPSERVIARYPVGLVVTVYVDPVYPISSVLVPGGDRWFWPFFLLFSGLLLLAGWLGKGIA